MITLTAMLTYAGIPEMHRLISDQTFTGLATCRDGQAAALGHAVLAPCGVSGCRSQGLVDCTSASYESQTSEVVGMAGRSVYTRH